METETNLSTNHSQEHRESSDHVIVMAEANANADAEWLTSMEEKTKKMPKLLSKAAGKTSCCIFRAPQSLVQVNDKAYQPLIVSVGPYHHGKEHLNMMQEHKWRYLGSVLARTRQHGIGLNEFFKAISPMEEKIRECYSETIEISSYQFIEMMILDGCFIIEVFSIVGRIAETNLDDPIFNMEWILSFLTRDLLRLENQIPFFVLQSLFELSILASRKRENQETCSLIEIALGFFSYAGVEMPNKAKDVKHLLDLFRSTFIIEKPNNDHNDNNNNNPFLQLIQSAKKLRQSGIKFKSRKKKSFLDIKISHGVLEIPTLIIDDFMSSVLLNCVAFEQCYKHFSKDITSYVIFMGCLIHKPDDAGYLSDKNIIENYFGTDDDVAKFFNDTGKDISFDITRSYLSNLFKDVNEYCSSNFHNKWAGFKHTYFDSPWSFMSASAVLIGLILTAIQAFFAVYPYAIPSQNKSN